MMTMEEEDKLAAAIGEVDIHKARCSTDNATFFYYTKQGLSFRCRHCKGLKIVSWEEILLQYQELCRRNVIEGINPCS